MAASPILAAAVIAALVGNVLQGLPVFASESVGFNWDRLNPIAGFSRLKGKISPLEWVKIIFLIGTATGVLWNTMRFFWPKLIMASALPIGVSSDIIVSMLIRIVSYLAVVL